MLDQHLVFAAKKNEFNANSVFFNVCWIELPSMCLLWTTQLTKCKAVMFVHLQWGLSVF